MAISKESKVSEEISPWKYQVWVLAKWGLEGPATSCVGKGSSWNSCPKVAGGGGGGGKMPAGQMRLVHFYLLAGQSLLDLEKPVSTESRPQRRPEFRERVYVGLLCERRDLGLKLALSNSPTLEGWTWGK